MDKVTAKAGFLVCNVNDPDAFFVIRLGPAGTPHVLIADSIESVRPYAQKNGCRIGYAMELDTPDLAGWLPAFAACNVDHVAWVTMDKVTSVPLAEFIAALPAPVPPPATDPAPRCAVRP